MKIQGLQKLTLLDFPGHVACTVFLGGCDFRCPFCHNGGLVDGSAPAALDDEALLSFLEKRRGLLDGVAFTGGEPLLRSELPQLMERVRALGYGVKLDTNGSHPAALRAIVEAGLVDYVAMDVKNSPAKYALTAGTPVDMDAVRRSAALLLSGAVDYEFRTTVVREFHEEEDFRAIGAWLAGAKRYFLQCFADRDSVLQGGLHAPSKEDLARYADIVRPFVPAVELRGV